MHRHYVEPLNLDFPISFSALLTPATWLHHPQSVKVIKERNFFVSTDGVMANFLLGLKFTWNPCDKRVFEKKQLHV